MKPRDPWFIPSQIERVSHDYYERCRLCARLQSATRSGNYR